MQPINKEMTASRLQFFGYIWLLIAAWWLGDQFLGVELKDGLLYSGEALRQLYPNNFERDPFFLGSTNQGHFTIFGWIYSHFMTWIGVRPAGLLMSVLGRILWILGALSLVRAFPKNANGIFPVLILMLALPAAYDGRQLFSYGEATVTSRCWAEAFLLFALAVQLTGKHKWGVLLLASIAALFHPLIALTGWCFLLCLQSPRVRNTGISLGLLSFFALATLKIYPFNNIFNSYDALWWKYINNVNEYVLIEGWPKQGYSKMLGWLALLVWTAFYNPNKILSRLARILAWVYAASILAWVVGCLTQNVLLIQLQTWRILWLVQLLAPALWVSGLRPWQEWHLRSWAQLALILIAILSTSWGISLMIIPALFLTHPALLEKPDSRLIKCLQVTVPILLLGMLLPARYQSFATRLYTHEMWGLPFPWIMALAAEPIVLLGAACILFCGHTYLQSKIQTTLLGALSLCMLCAITVISTQQVLRTKAPQPDVSQLKKIIPPGSVIYWNAGVGTVWFLLERAQYAGPLQGSGSLFSRESTMEFFRRIDWLRSVDPKVSGFERAVTPDGSELAQPMTVAEFCGDPVLDFVLVGGDYPGAHHVVPYTGNKDKKVSVVDCKQIRSQQQ